MFEKIGREVSGVHVLIDPQMLPSANLLLSKHEIVPQEGAAGP